jgi:hypothetical protein
MEDRKFVRHCRIDKRFISFRGRIIRAQLDCVYVKLFVRNELRNNILEQGAFMVYVCVSVIEWLLANGAPRLASRIVPEHVNL